MLVHIKEIIPKAYRDGYAVGAFNTIDLETTLAIIQAAQAKKSPVIIQVSETTLRYGGVKPITHVVQTIAKNEAVNVPVALHLDHGKSFHFVVECINSGFSSIMLDASDLPFDENVALTKNAVEYAKKRNVWSQGEIGRLAGVEDEISVKEREAQMTTPEDAVAFAKETKVDTLAIAVGQSHGALKLKKGVPKLNIKRLSEISKKVNIPLVLHGSSGVSKKDISQAIKNKVSIMNIDTDLRVAFSKGLRKALEENPEAIDARKYFSPAIKAMQKIVEEKIEMFGSAGKA